MKAIVYHGKHDFRFENAPDPKITAEGDTIVRVAKTAICGSDLHLWHGGLPEGIGASGGFAVGHEFLGIVDEVGRGVSRVKRGDRVLVSCTVGCGGCGLCQRGVYSGCTVMTGGGGASNVFGFSQGLPGGQAEAVRVPFSDTNLFRVPEALSDEQALFLTDILPTGYMGAELAEVSPGDTVVVFGCGPVGLFAIASAKLLGAGRIFAVDCIESRLDMACRQGAEIIDFNKDDPVAVIRRLTGDIGADRVIDAVGVDAVAPRKGPAAAHARKERKQNRMEVEQVAPDADPKGDLWVPGNAPSQVVNWAVEAVAKAGTLSIIGVYPDSDRFFPLGLAVGKNLTINSGNCNHRAYVPMLVDLVRSGAVDPAEILTQTAPLASAIDAYQAFDRREPGWVKVKLEPETQRAAA
jgi:threonine dehydrogenase-like Zn-dependent dehydrogenase